MDLADLMREADLTPTQTDVHEENILAYADAMRKAADEPGAWNWNYTANDPLSPMIVDAQGRILAGHHRFIAAWLAGIEVPTGVVKTLNRSTAGRPVYDWADVTVRPGSRPPRRTF